MFMMANALEELFLERTDLVAIAKSSMNQKYTRIKLMKN